MTRERRKIGRKEGKKERWKVGSVVCGRKESKKSRKQEK